MDVSLAAETQFNTCDLYDAHEDVARVLPPTLRDFGGRKKFAGAAVTVKCLEDATRVRELVRSPGSGQVLIVDGGGQLKVALLGDRLAASAVENGWAGVVVYGLVRDVVGLAALDLGVKALGTTPRKGSFAGGGEIGVSIEIDGVTCSPGDRVFADEDGIVLLPPAAP